MNNNTSNEEAKIKEENSNQSQGDKADSSASKNPEVPKRINLSILLGKIKNLEKKQSKELSNLKNTKVLYTYDRIFNSSAIETTKDTLDIIKLIEGISSVERSQKVQPMMNHARKEVG